jgi:hypothetical protein
MQSCSDSIPFPIHSSTAWVPCNHIAFFFSVSITLLHFRPATDMAQRSLRPPAELAPSAVLRPAVPCSSPHMPIHPPVSQLAPVWLLFWICRRCMLWRLRHFVRLHEVSSWYLTTSDEHPHGEWRAAAFGAAVSSLACPCTMDPGAWSTHGVPAL